MTQLNAETINPSPTPDETLQHLESDKSIQTVAPTIIHWLIETAKHNLFEQPWHN